MYVVFPSIFILFHDVRKVYRSVSTSVHTNANHFYLETEQLIQMFKMVYINKYQYKRKNIMVYCFHDFLALCTGKSVKRPLRDILKIGKLGRKKSNCTLNSYFGRKGCRLSPMLMLG